MVEQHLTSWNQRSVISPASTIVIDLDASLQGWRATVRELGPLSMDLFASRLSNQLPKFVSWKPDPLAMATNAFTLTWSDLSQKVYANPPWNLIGRVLSKVCDQSILELILIAPVWKAQAWYPLLLQKLVRVPILFPVSSEMVRSVCQNYLPDILPQLAVWVISGKDVSVATFQEQLQIWSSPHGGKSHQSLVNPPSKNGQAGVMNRIEIPFVAL